MSCCSFRDGTLLCISQGVYASFVLALRDRHLHIILPPAAQKKSNFASKIFHYNVLSKHLNIQCLATMRKGSSASHNSGEL